MGSFAENLNFTPSPTSAKIFTVCYFYWHALQTQIWIMAHITLLYELWLGDLDFLSVAVLDFRYVIEKLPFFAANLYTGTVSILFCIE